jgi:hypothetical protein
MAAFLGAAVGAFVVYLGLASFGTNGSDLSDLTIVVWYSFLFGAFLRGFLQVLTFSLHGGLGFLRAFVHAFLFFFFLALTLVRALLSLLARVIKCFTSLLKDCSLKKKDRTGF